MAEVEGARVAFPDEHVLRQLARPKEDALGGPPVLDSACSVPGEANKRGC